MRIDMFVAIGTAHPLRWVSAILKLPSVMNDQVRWPTRCKRCFRDYKEHADDHDKARFGNLKDNDSGKAEWPVDRNNFHFARNHAAR